MSFKVKCAEFHVLWVRYNVKRSQQFHDTGLLLGNSLKGLIKQEIIGLIRDLIS